MKLSEVKKHLTAMNSVRFQLTDGSYVPDHFHVTEIGQVTKNFIDCGGTVRHEHIINFQLWTSDDVEHRLYPKKLLDIIALSEKILDIEDQEVEVEYQSETIGKYALNFNGTDFILETKQTNCLANDACGLNIEAENIPPTDLNQENKNSCTPNSGCCS
jgi:hypothetical protein